MNLSATGTFFKWSILLLGLLVAPAIAHAQPIEDPGLAEPTPPPKPAPPKQPLPTVPPVVAPQVPIETHESVDTQVQWIAGGEAAVQAEGDLYERVPAPTVFGPIGLLRTITGDAGRTNTFRVGLHLGGFKQDSFLISGAGSVPGDSNAHFAGDLTIDYTPWKYLEVYLALFNSSNQNTRTDPGRTDPEVILALGDLGLGVKGRYPVLPFWDLALHLGVRFMNSVSGISFSGDSTNFAADLVSSWDLRHAEATRVVPLRFHLNFGFYLDNSINLLPAGQCVRSTGNDVCIRSRVVETYAYGLGADRFRIALAADAPVEVSHVGLEPFVEYHIDASVGSGDQTVYNALKNDPNVSQSRLTGLVSQWLTIGFRVRPIAGLVLDAGVDVGLQSPGFQYGPPVPAWNVIAGAAYAYDPHASQAKTKVVTKTVTRELVRGGNARIRGIVRDASTRKILAGATVRYLNRVETPQLTADDGTFVSTRMTPGPVAIEVSRDDYHPTRVDVSALENRETPVEVLLTAKPPAAGQIHGKVSDASGQSVAATVRLTNVQTGAIVDAEVEAPGGFGARLPAGDYSMEVVATGYLAKQRPVAVTPGSVQSVDVVLTKKPPVSHVKLAKDQITVKGVVHFGTNDAQLQPDGEQLLDEVADVLIRHPELKRVRVDGHTDNRGNAQHNLELSKARAAAVVTYLVKQGVDPARLDSEGYGAEKPLVPNLTPGNRARNRRVEFKILERTDVSPAH
jgi:outer membrane protein OmpA-like peptidoglycan-associated protein